MTTLIVFAADWHANTRGAGLCPPVVHLQDGDFTPNAAQLAVWDAHVAAWGLMARIAMQHSAKLVAVLVGDLGDSNGSPGKFVHTTNEAEVINFVGQCLEPVAQVADRLYVVRGTERHSGARCWLEETVAEKAKAAKDVENGTYSWWWLPLECDGVRFDIAHHPKTSGYRPWTAQSAAARESAIIRDDYFGRGPVPHVAVRAHVHYGADSGIMCQPRVVFCPPWQLTTAYGYRLGAAGHVEPVGLWWFLCDQGRILQSDIETYEPRRREWVSTT